MKNKIAEKKGVDVYTADLGLGVGDDHNRQEQIQAHANLGQIMSALMTLREGGCMITKQYTTFEPITISIIIVVASLFDKFHIIKPHTSRKANSEIYLFGRGFRGMSNELEESLLNKIENWSETPLLSKKTIMDMYNLQFNQIFDQSKTLGKAQSKKIDLIMKYNNKYLNIKEKKKLFGRVRWEDTRNRERVQSKFDDEVEIRKLNKDNKYYLNAKKIMFKK